jgi:hypothetical protein
MHFTRVKIITTSPREYADAIRQALADAGAGKIGEYRDCSFSIVGQGRSRPTDDADPYIGRAGKLEVIEEEQISVVCDCSQARHVIAELRRVHPYEEPIVEIHPLLDEVDL